MLREKPQPPAEVCWASAWAERNFCYFQVVAWMTNNPLKAPALGPLYDAIKEFDREGDGFCQRLESQV